MPIGKEQFLKQFTQQALDERISLFIVGNTMNWSVPLLSLQ